MKTIHRKIRTISEKKYMFDIEYVKHEPDTGFDVMSVKLYPIDIEYVVGKQLRVYPSTITNEIYDDAIKMLKDDKII